MRGLSLTQPWAQLMALGVKQVETRSWTTSYRGLIAIHAAKAFPRDARDLAEGAYAVRAVLERGGMQFSTSPPAHWYHAPRYRYVTGLPLGAIVAVAHLVNVCPAREVRETLGEQELAFGDYDDDRFAWRLSGVVRLAVPIACRGALGLWRLPPDVADQLAVAEVLS